MATFCTAPTDEVVEQVWLPIVAEAVPRLFAHERMVAAVALRIADASGVSIPCLYEAALLHDVGRMAMLGVTDHPDPLSERQRRLVQIHPIIGAEIAKAAGLPVDAVLAIRHHHERWDGTGYPDGLREEEIPPGARILAVADAVVSMLEKRDYSGGRKVTDEVAAELRRCAGKQFDPHIATTAAELVQMLEIHRIMSEEGLRR